eukprot:1164172-Amphidinium_carterae.1
MNDVHPDVPHRWVYTATEDNLFLKMCCMQKQHGINKTNAVNLDESSCQLLPVHDVGWSEPSVKSSAPHGHEA